MNVSGGAWKIVRRWWGRFFCVLIVLGFVAAGGVVQAASNDAYYQVQPGDVLHVAVYGEEGLSYAVPVQSDGTISYPFVGHRSVQGMTLEDVEALITDKLEAVMRVPVVSVSAAPAKGPFIIVLGEVRTPGIYPVTGPSTSLLEVIASAGGTTDRADLGQVRIYEEGNVRNYADAPIGGDGLLFHGDPADNPTLATGQIVYVPPLADDGYVTILGEVRTPGTYVVDSGRDVRLLDLLARAGGPTDTADLSAVKVYEQGDVDHMDGAPIDASGLLFDGEPIANVVLTPGNVVYVPPGLINVVVMGPVARPGAYALRPQTRVLQLLGEAGGLLESADATTMVLRREEAGGQVSHWPIDLDAVLSGTAPEENYALNDQDVLVIQSLIQVAVAGEVRNNGVFPLRGQARVTDAILAASGPTEQAGLSALTITRTQGGETQIITVDYDRVLAGKETNVRLRDGDIINVPRSERMAFVAGEVHNPGAYPLGESTRLIELIYTAGGPTLLGDREHIEIVDSAGQTVFEGAIGDNPLVAPGDTVVVPRETIDISVLGSAGRTGRIEVSRQSRVLDVVAAIGGPDSDGDWTQVYVSRAGEDWAETHVVDVTALLSSPGSASNIRMQPGDLVYVPSSAARITVVGEVPRPGTYAIDQDNARLVDALAAAGGASPRASLEEVSILVAGDALRQVHAPIGKHDKLAPDQIDETVRLSDGDVVVVPHSNRVTWQDVVTVLSGIKLIKDLLD